MLAVIGMTVFLFSTGCKKDGSTNNSVDLATEVTAQSDDQTETSNDFDATNNDVAAAIESSAFFSGRTEKVMSICGATASYDSTSNPRKITITYNGADCFGLHTRTGTVVLSMPPGVHWKDAGAAITVTVQNLKITRVIDNKSITINGSETVTNVNGGLLFNLATVGTITHTANGSFTITFDNNTQRTWNEGKKRVFTYNNGIVITTTGTHTEGSNTQVAEWGTNRFGHSFTTSITSPLVIRQDCNFRLTSGEVKHEGVVTATATFGLDASGNATSCPGLGNYYFKLVWTDQSGGIHTVIHPY